MENIGFRTLAPATRPRSPPPAPPELIQRRKRTTVACDCCRERRTGCDGARPVCAAYHKRSTSCTYVNEKSLEMRPTVLKRENIVLREKIAAFQEIVRHIESLPQHAVREILQSLRDGSDPINLLKTIQSQQMKVVPSAMDTARALMPQIPSKTEFELMIRHPDVFPVLDLSSQAQHMGTTLASTSALPSVLHPSPSSSCQDVSAQPGSSKFAEHKAEFSFSNIRDFSSLEDQSNSAKSEYFDSRLSTLEISFWTTVPITNTQASTAISCYLEVQHPIWGVFDASLFVKDLIGFGFQFCSPFMVSALLAVACCVYAPLDMEASGHSYAFEREAEKLFSSETELDSLPTVAGLLLLYMSLSTHGEGLRALKFLHLASATAERMGLRGEPGGLRDANNVSPEMSVARSATAWGLFNMIVFLARLYLVPPVGFPPRLPLPGTLKSDRKYTESCKAKLDRSTVTLFEMGPVQACVTKFWIVMNEVFLVYRDQAHNVASLAFALSKYSKLLRLFHDLPESLKRKRQSTNHALIYHMHLHLGIMDIFRPFLPPDDGYPSRSYLPVESSPRGIYAASVRQVKGLIFEYVFQYTPDSYSLLFPGAIIYAVNAILNDSKDPERRNYLFFYMEVGRRLRSLGSARTVNNTLMAMLALAYSKGVINQAEAIWWKNEFNKDELFVDRKFLTAVRSGWAVDMDVAAVDIAAGNADVLADRLAEITLLDQFTVGIS